MRIGRICLLRLPSHFKKPALWSGVWSGVFAILLGFAVAPALAQKPLGAAAVASGAAAAATVSAPAPAGKKSATSAALDAALMGNTALAQPGAKDRAPTEEAAIGGVPALLAAAAAGPPLKGVAAQCVNLLKMATNLKAEVDKTTKDVLSVAVIRDAGQIEQMAKKMREEQH